MANTRRATDFQGEKWVVGMCWSALITFLACIHVVLSSIGSHSSFLILPFCPSFSTNVFSP